ncbi:CGNR zinc finger domain-containing protein [Streptomyces lonarensis]|uniref:CGNR zinc finger domain-containing protein n=1 Tax=Streptomyces lonarensis TaxID=700599 RepID=A0A7X6D1N7_9ACTN|nr:CGNR zinc finger domain-containing protein [Streptomyces lonarensis]
MEQRRAQQVVRHVTDGGRRGERGAESGRGDLQPGAGGEDLGPAAFRGVVGAQAEHAAVPRLSRHDGHGWHLHVHHEQAGWAGWFLASGALALAGLLSEHGRAPWGECGAPGCRRLFLGTGPGAAQRYCSQACATRVRVA